MRSCTKISTHAEWLTFLVRLDLCMRCETPNDMLPITRTELLQRYTLMHRILYLAENDRGWLTVTEFRGSHGMEVGKGDRYLASGRHYGNALLGVRHQEDTISADASRILTSVHQSDWKRPAGHPHTSWHNKERPIIPQPGRLKMREWKNRHGHAWVENAGVN